MAAYIVRDYLVNPFFPDLRPLLRTHHCKCTMPFNNKAKFQINKIRMVDDGTISQSLEGTRGGRCYRPDVKDKNIKRK